MTAGPQHWWQAPHRQAARIPLRVKLITVLLALVAIALVAISVAGISYLRTYLLSEQDGTLRAEAGSYAQAGQGPVTECLQSGGSACGRLSLQTIAVDWLPSHGPIQRVVIPAIQTGMSASGQATYHYTPGPDVSGAAQWLSTHHGGTTTVPAIKGDRRWRLLAVQAVEQTQAGPQTGTIVVGMDVSSVYNTIGRLVKIDMIVSGIMLAALAIVGIGIVRSSLRPLTDIERTARKIASGDLSQRVPNQDPQTEVGRLAWALNTMLTQIEAAFHARAQSEQSARASEERMRQFVADASHELRTPVTVIRGYAEYYRQRGGLDPSAFPAAPPATEPSPVGNGAAPGQDPLTRADMDRIIERVEQESTRMGGLVEDLLLLARLDQQRPVERRPVDLLTLAGDAVADARAIAPNRKIELSVGAGAAFLVLGDEGRLRQVIGNLMSNALTHTPDGTPVEVRIRAGQKAGAPPVPGVTLEVADTGPGMTAEQASRVFERFYRADQARDRRTGGTGLGLAIVSALVAAHGGTVSVDTAPGKGATFRICLPLAPEAQDGGGES